MYYMVVDVYVNNFTLLQTISFGSRKISYHRVKKARHGKATILASELTALVWTPLELAISTLNGRKGQFGKMQLDEEMVDGIISMYQNQMS